MFRSVAQQREIDLSEQVGNTDLDNGTLSDISSPPNSSADGEVYIMRQEGPDNVSHLYRRRWAISATLAARALA